MLPSSIRFALALVLFVLGTFIGSMGRPEGLLMIIGGIYWLFTYVRYGPVKLAFAAYRQGDLDKVAGLIDGVRWPRLLAPRHRLYYHWARGAVAARDGRLDEAHDDYARAYAGRLRDDGDRSVLAALLAEIELDRGDRDAAAAHVAEARRLEHRIDLDPLLDELEKRATR